MKFEQFLNESINDEGIFKAIFVVGIPGAGKSYTTTKLKGKIQPRIVNTDKALEFLSKKKGIEANSETWKTIFGDDSKRITKNMLYNYLNGCLPLFIDGTSSDASNILSRAGILESLGYDVGMIFVETNVDTAISRAEERSKEIGRSVSIDFIKKVFTESESNKDYFKSKFSFFKTFNNDEEFNDEFLNKLYNNVQSFFESDVKNPIGKRHITKMKQNGFKYIDDGIFEKDVLETKITNWYKR